MANIYDVSTFKYEKVADVQVTAEHGTSWDTIATMTIIGLPAGIYMMGINFLVDYLGVKDKSLWTKVTGTYAIGTEFADRASTDSDKKNRFYEVAIEHAADGNCTINLEMSLGTGLTALTVDSAQVIINRVGDIA